MALGGVISARSENEFKLADRTSSLAEPFRASYVVWERRRRSRKALSPGRPRSMGDAGCTRTFSFVVVGMFGAQHEQSREAKNVWRRASRCFSCAGPGRHAIFFPRSSVRPAPPPSAPRSAALRMLRVAQLAPMCAARHGCRLICLQARTRSFFSPCFASTRAAAFARPRVRAREIPAGAVRSACPCSAKRRLRIVAHGERRVRPEAQVRFLSVQPTRG